MKNLSIRVKITAWFSGIMAFIVAVTFAVIFLGEQLGDTEEHTG